MYKPRTRAICRECGREMMRGQVVRHWQKEHKELFYKKGEEMPGGWGAIDLGGGQMWRFLADCLPGEV